VKSLPILFVAGICAILAVKASSAEVAVGNCRPHLVSYSTISEAVAAVPPGSTVLVCPGTYPEQVTINQPLTLKGLSDGLNSKAVITVPSGGLAPSSEQQLLVEAPDPFSSLGPVDIINLVVDGSSSGVDCSMQAEFIGISYIHASGTLDNVEVRSQNPGGCGFGILLLGSQDFFETVNVRNSNIHDFDNTGVLAVGAGGTGFVVNLTASFIESASASVQAGVDYEEADGLAGRNYIAVVGEVGLELGNYFPGMTATENTISGANIGIVSGFSLDNGPTVITRNSLFNNKTGIFISEFSGNDVVNSNTIVQSGTVAIDTDCSPATTAERNIISGAPVGIANVSSGDTVNHNVFYGVPDTISLCQF
jgi:hypothetical protein